MIAFLSGRLITKEPTHLLIDVSGVGYLVKISLQTYSSLQVKDDHIKIHTLLIVKEDSHTLYGFSKIEEKQLFEHLISVSGIGPNTAIVMLSSLTSGEIMQALVSEDVKTIQSIKGIGAKTAQRAIIELKDKLKKELISDGVNPTVFANQDLNLRSEALTALTTLGIPKATAEKSIDTILRRSGGDISLEELIKLALR
ncbi:Holliday junction branch migration protein RuvA [Jiulongibacter sediminis]|uniref:Holliday junction branch migration complex subunit RuvA n=1 Tax=Jiulongibacter sediminis TaxID=1605367 RepID=A0A0P7BRI4_9BACT|nr:Holliday junction branch migration protein RuvA [Jiulongibacter sediminis]KPM49915.1 ATP-dependent DNA helicase RuvA [Jiulongibacter sediminis]TBX26951.1 ATP-dependent DNA helicase RuvA [Jiulongibacter sediminis]